MHKGRDYFPGFVSMQYKVYKRFDVLVLSPPRIAMDLEGEK